MGRPTTYNKATAEKILERIASGESLISICSDDDMPGERTVYQWLLRDECQSFAQDYACARGYQADHFFEEITAIRKDLRAGKIDANQARVEIDAIKWQAGKLKPKKYSDNKHIHELTGKDGGPIELSDTERAAKVAGILAKADILSGDSGNPES